jgi:ribosomal protein S18 acetylase RimI-like enzyme
MYIVVRPAAVADAPRIADLVKELAASVGESSPITAAYVEAYLQSHGNGVLVAEDKPPGPHDPPGPHNQSIPGCTSSTSITADGRPPLVGLISFSVRPNLFHAANSALIEELVVAESYRGRGVGGALVQTLLAKLEKDGCAEVSVTVMPDNAGALRFYRAHGLVDEAVYLEKHFGDPNPA